MADFDGVINPAAENVDVPQLSTEARLLGGAGGPLNAQAVALVKRQKFHEQAADPHPQYLTQTEGDARYQQIGGGGGSTYTDEMAQDAVGAAFGAGTGDGMQVTYDDAGNRFNVTNTDKGSTARTAHEAAADPHPQYLTAAEGNAAYAPLSSVITNSDQLTEGTTNLWFTAARVRAAVLSGLSFAAATAVQATDTVLAGIGKLQAQFTAHEAAADPHPQYMTAAETEDSVLKFRNKPFNLTLLDFQFSDATTGWSTSANQTVSYDATNKGLRIKGNGVSGTNIITTKTLPNPISSSSISRVGVKFRSNTPGLQAGLYIQLGNAGGTFSALNAAYSLFQIVASDDPEWHWAVFNTAEDATFSGLGTLTQVRFRTNGQSAPFLNDVTIAKVVINPDTISPVVFTFDDGWDTAYTKAFPKLSANGFKGSVFWPSSGASGVGADRRIDNSELLSLKNAGWDISLDGTDDDSALTAQATLDSAVQKFLKGQQVALAAGITSEDYSYLCYPNGLAWVSTAPVQIAAATSNGTSTINLGAAATIPNGSAYYAANAPDGTTVVTGGTNVTSITVSQNIPAGTIAAATVDLSSVFSRNALTDRLASVGVRGARLTGNGDNSIIEGLLNPMKVYAIGFTGKTLNQTIAELTALKNRGVPIVMYFHEIQEDVGGWTADTANASIHVYQSFFNGIVDLVKTWTNAGTAENLTFKKLITKYGPAR